MRPRSWLRRLRRKILGNELHLWYDPAYRLPVTTLEPITGLEPRRADWVAWYLVNAGLVSKRHVHTPQRISYRDLARVHPRAYLESLDQPEVLARIFGVHPTDLPVTSVMSSLRLACGGTLEAARDAVIHRRPTMNLLGGFHHAEPDRGGGLCPINDMATALAVLRDEGFRGQVAMLDLDAHPPDGLAAFFGADPSVWVGSLSGTDWGELPGVDETLLPSGCDDATYLSALDALLERMPARIELAFVIAGGDILASDHMGGLGLTLAGARSRDLKVVRRLRGLPSVWLPGGGYSADAWKVLAGTGLALVLGSDAPIGKRYHPMTAQFASISDSMEDTNLEGASFFTEADLEDALGLDSRRRNRLLGYYTVEGIEHALSRFGLLDYLRRLGFGNFRISIDGDGGNDRIQLFGLVKGDDQEHMLFEALYERMELEQGKVLYVHWLTLRNPIARFSDLRPRLPGQEAPGLGLAREAGEMLVRMAQRLDLDGVAFRPAYFHTAYATRGAFVFAEPARQGRFEAMLRDLGHLHLLDITTATSEGRVRLNGEPYTWEAELMVTWHTPKPLDSEAAEIKAAEKARSSFSIAYTR